MSLYISRACLFYKALLAFLCFSVRNRMVLLREPYGSR